MTFGTAPRPRRRLAKTSLLLYLIAAILIIVASAIPVTVTKTNEANVSGSFLRSYYENQNAPVTGCTSPCLTVDTQTTQPTGIALSPALDGSNFAVSASGTITTLATTLTTTNSPDVIILLTTTQVTTGYVTVSSISAAGLTFTKRTSISAAVGGFDEDFEEWYAITSSTLSGLTITVTYSGTVTHYAVLNVFGLSRANTNSPFDPNGGLPSVRTQAAASITTSNANDFVFGFELTMATASPTHGAGWTTISAPATDYFGSEYQQVTTTQSALTVTWSNAATDADVMLGEAIQGSNSFTLPSGSSMYMWSPQIASATTIAAGTWGIDFWASGFSYVPITLTNNQGAATPNPLQVKISWNPSTYSSYESNTLSNVRFCLDKACNTMLYAWLESCTPSCSTSGTSASAWVKLTSSIGASGGTLTVYMVFQAKTAQFDANYWGEAPNLSGTFGQYDNGANVFTFYDNFAGTTLSSKWTVVSSGAGGSVTVNNGATFTTATANDWVFVRSANQPQPQVAEAYMVSESTNVDPMLGVSTTATANNWAALYNGYSVDDCPAACGGPGLAISYQLSTGGGVVSSQAENFNAGIWQIVWSATGSESASDGAITLTGTDNHAAIANYGIYVGQSNIVAGSNVARWARMRALPPNNGLPSVSVGAFSSNKVSVSAYVTNSAGTVTGTVATGIQSPVVGTSVAEYTTNFAGAQVTIPANGYISVVILASTDTCTFYWGGTQPTNFQVSYTSRST